MVWRWVNSRCGGSGHVAVGLQEGLDGLHEPGLVLLVVGDQRLDRLGVEALQLGRVLAHRAEQQAIGARTPRRRAPGARRRPRRRWPPAAPRRRRGADRRGPARGAAAPEREGVARAARSAARAGWPRPRARRVASSAPGSRTTTSAPTASARAASTAAAPGSTARAPRSATPRTRWRQPSSVGTWECARATTMLAPSTRSIPSSPARPRMSSRPEMSRSSSACTKPASACSEARSGARRRSTSEAIRVVTSLTRRGSRLAARAHAQRARPCASATRSSSASTPARVVQQRALVGRRARGDGQHGPGAVGQHQAGVERPRRRAHDLGQAGTRLDGVGDRVQRSEVEPGRRSLGRAWTCTDSRRTVARSPTRRPGPTC